ncbi:hypothetical protein BCIN_01g10630 [Botrytis cinerea B05.10]|uniref:Uncharacterized protein n=1 Tax=Botryotinia fuckeliana (strain B05.10) TaxID=332648 RepID=A0A384J6Z7_BOTFB|nr:hypothetical protein BCIN_01g10630 [Botrytis cinerea B05.10]ATZ46478.1 hypothetical protein BCIN_01g10630 [Botrytis cinerea B05.10]
MPPSRCEFELLCIITLILISFSSNAGFVARQATEPPNAPNNAPHNPPNSVWL